MGNLENIYQNYYDHHIDLVGNSEEQLAARLLIEEGLIFESEERRLSLYEGQILDTYKKMSPDGFSSGLIFLIDEL